MDTRVHIFAGRFASREDATAYSEEQWAPEPGEHASDDEYAAWEDNNPAWAMRDDLGLDNLDHDFIETLHADDEHDVWKYLGGLLKDPDALVHVRDRVGSANTLILTFGQAFDGAKPDLDSTPQLAFCDTWPANFDEGRSSAKAASASDCDGATLAS